MYHPTDTTHRKCECVFSHVKEMRARNNGLVKDLSRSNEQTNRERKKHIKERVRYGYSTEIHPAINQNGFSLNGFCFHHFYFFLLSFRGLTRMQRKRTRNEQKTTATTTMMTATATATNKLFSTHFTNYLYDFY